MGVRHRAQSTGGLLPFAIDRAPRAGRLSWTVPPVDGALDEELERVVDRDSVQTDVARGMQALSSERRHAVHLRIVEGQDYRDIAASLGCSEQTAQRMFPAVRRLAKTLDRQKPPASELTAR